MALQAGLRGQYFSICLLFIPELQNTPPSSPSNLLRWISLALTTLAATSALDSAALLSTSLLGSTGDIHNCMSIHTMYLSGQKNFITLQKREYKMAKAIIWCRVSTDYQEIETQKSDLTSWATSPQEGYSKDDLIVIGEKGASAIKMNELYQKEVNQLIKTIETDPSVNSVYVWEVSRLARNEEAFVRMKKVLETNKIQLCCKEPSLKLLNTDGSINHGSELTFNLLITLAKQEMEIKAKRFARGKKRLAQLGRYNGGAIPYGYKVDYANNNLIVPDDEESAIVREIYDMYERGYSQTSIAKILHFRGVKGRAVRKTKNFTISLVHQILTNKLLTGEPHLSKGASYSRTYPPIISVEQFNNCREIAKRNNTSLPKGRVPYYGSKIIKCRACGRNFVGTGMSGYYQCGDVRNINKKYNGYEGEPRCESRVTISYNVMDALLWRMAQVFEIRYIADKAKHDVETYSNNIISLNKELDVIPSLLDGVAQERIRLAEVYTDGLFGKDEYVNKKRAISQKETEIKRHEAYLLEQIRHNELLLKGAENSSGYKSMLFNDTGRLDAIDEELNAITDVETRKAIIRKHIKYATVEKLTIKHQFSPNSTPKDVLAKKITIYSFSNVVRIFIFIPYNGKGGCLYEQHGKRLHLYKLTFFENKYARHKIKKREQIKKERLALKAKTHDVMLQQGYIPMEEMMSISGLSYSTIYNAIKSSALADAKNVHHKWYVQRKTFVEYLHDKSPKPRRRNE